MGKQILAHTPKRVIGVIKDFHIAFHASGDSPCPLMMSEDYFTHIALKIRPQDMDKTSGRWEESVKARSPYPFEFRFLTTI